MFTLDHVCKSFGSRRVLSDVSFSTSPGKTTALIGPSGCGKSTLFSLMTGLLTPDAGEITFEGRPISRDSLPALRRRIGYVIQEGGLFPHLTARANVTLMARHVGMPAERIDARVDELAALARLAPELLARYPGELSGGQRQRVSLMRALMLDADVLLLDEPLAALDPMVRAELQDDLAEIFGRLAKTVVIVTHDLNEAAFFAEEVILLRAGGIAQRGTIRDLLDRPADPFVTQFVRGAAGAGDGMTSLPGRFGAFVLVCVLCLLTTLSCDGKKTVHVGSKVFTESVILGELATQLGRDAGVNSVHRSQLGGTRVLWDALRAGQIDAYPEYTGTIAQELLPGTPATEDALRAALLPLGIGMTHTLGFNDTYALGMPEALAQRLGIKAVGDLRAHAEIRFGFSNEFLERKDGWPAVRSTYGLAQKNVTGLDHDLAYRAVASGTTDVIDLYSTDAEIAFYHLRVLDDDRHLFPEYKAVYLYRLDLQQRAPAFVAALTRLENAIDAPQMIALNAASKLDKVPEARVASDFLLKNLATHTDVVDAGLAAQLLRRTGEHLFMVVVSLAASIAVAIPLGVFAFILPRVGHVILGAVAAIYTIPSLALLVFMIPVLGIGTWPAIVALFLYGLLPIVRNTHAGLSGIAPALRESATVLGLSRTARLLQVELPMASRSILAGIKTAGVINVGTATLGRPNRRGRVRPADPHRHPAGGQPQTDPAGRDPRGRDGAARARRLRAARARRAATRAASETAGVIRLHLAVSVDAICNSSAEAALCTASVSVG